MRILSYNVRGLGNGVKRKEIRDLICNQKIEICFIQETKMESIDIGVCRGIWGNRKCGWVSRQAIGRSGGIATFWDVEFIQCSSAWHLNGILVVNAVRTSDLADLCLINIYAPCNPRDKKELWGILNMVIDQNRDKLICLAGDFNAVRNEVERVGRSGCTNKREMEDFDKFIRDSNLIDLPLSGRSYTWYRPDGSCKSRLDHFLLNEEWISCYPVARLKGLPRSISDHCPLILEDGLIDWGPKPSRFSNAWLLHPSFKDSLISMWQNLNIGGRGSFIVKEKFKSLKIGLREWSKNTFGNLDQRIESNKQELLNLDLLDDTFGLEMDEIDRRRDLMRDIFWDCSLRQNILCQKAKIQWIKQGDVNTHYFHKCINARRKANDLSAVGVNHRGLEAWSGVIQKIKNRLRAWEDRKISFGGRIILLNAVLNSLPTYYLSFYRIPKHTLREIVKLQRDFLWGGGVNGKKIPWVAWNDICKSKVDGGLGVKHLDLFNKSLLGKWAWRIRVEPNSLWVRILDSKYGACSTFLSSSCVNRKYMSGWWREIFDLFFSTSKCPWFEVSVDDLWTWTLTNDGQYTTQSAYQCQVVQVPATSILSEDTYKVLSRIWNKLTPSKFSGLAWRILRCRLPTRSALKKRNILTDGDDLSCGLCGSYEETVQHLLIQALNVDP
ncbi:hypothetical protein ACS0TY_017963 [Phlomoides rotata]